LILIDEKYGIAAHSELTGRNRKELPLFICTNTGSLRQLWAIEMPALTDT
jgi:hypothetical protein